MIYTPNAAEDDMGMNPPSSYYIITRRKQGPFLIQKMPELCGPFGFKRTPAYQFIGRLRDYKPHLKDVLIVSSTASTDVGLITRADKALSNDESAQGTVNLFTTTEVSDDTKRASLPLKDSVDETSVIGLGIDLTSTEKVVSPIQGEDILESPTPLPNILLLNNEGILCSWWFIYSDAIRQNVAYQGLVSVSPQQQQQLTPAQPSQTQPPAQSAFGQSSFGQSAFGSPSALTANSPFGKPSAGPSFGSPLPLAGGGQAGQAPAFGKPSFGAPSAIGGSSFGQTSTIGQGTPQFGKSGFGSTPAFGQPSGFGQPSTPGKGFGSLASSGGGFSSFANANAGGFASFASAKPGESPFGKPAAASPFGQTAGQSPFAKAAGESPFGKPATGESPFAKLSGPSAFGQPDTKTAFPPPSTDASKGPLGLGSGGFQLGSTFKGDGTAVNDGPKPEKPSGGGLFSLGTSFDEMVSTPDKTSPPAESMDDGEDVPAAEQPEPAKPAAPQPAPSIFGQPSAPAPAPSIFNPPKPSEQPAPAPQTKSPFSLFGSGVTQNKPTSPFSPLSEKTATPKKESPKEIPVGTPAGEPPLPPDPTSRAVYGPGDTSASSNVSKDSVDEAPLSPDFTAKPKPAAKEEAPLPPDFTAKLKEAGGEPPLPPDFTVKPKEAEVKKEAEEAPLPPEPATPASVAGPAEGVEESPIPDESDADEEEEEAESEREGEEEDEDEEGEEDEEEQEGEEGDEEGDEEGEEFDFADSGEEITHDVTQTEGFQSPKTSLESSFGEKSPAGGLFTRISKPDEQQKQPSKGLFGEISKQPFFPPQTKFGSPRSPSPMRAGAQKGPSKLDSHKHFAPSHGPGDTLAARKAALKESNQRKPKSADLAAREEQARLQAEAQRQEEEALSLSEDDEDERLRADLSRPLAPVPTLDPFLAHQDYSGETTKPGIPGQIERLYRDINSMVDTLGINARSLASFVLYQKAPQDHLNWIDTVKGDNPAAILDEKFLLSQIEKLDDAVITLAGSLQQQRVQGVEEKLDSCRELLGKDIVALRGQCASIRKTLDAHVDTAAILSAPLSAEQANLQQDLRTASTDLQAKLADLEQGVSLLRAKIAEAPRPDGTAPTKRPTVEAVTSTIATMMNMAESKSGDIDVLEVQLKKLGIDTSAPSASRSREGSPFATPKKGIRTFPTTPGSRGSLDGSFSAYQTPDSASRGVNLRSSINGSARVSRLRNVEGVGAGDLGGKQESEQWKAKNTRRQHIVGNLKKAIGEKEKVRGVDDM